MGKKSGIIYEQGQLSADPAAPTAGYSIIYPKTDGRWYVIVSDSTVTDIIASYKAITIAAAVPTALEIGDLSINQVDNILFWKDNIGTIRQTPLSSSNIISVTAAATTNINLMQSNIQKINLGISITTLNLNNAVAGFRYQLLLAQDATGSRTISWPSSVKWSGGTAPTLTTTANKTDIVSMIFDGTYFYAGINQNF